MRLSKTIEIGKKTVTIKELRIQDILDLFNWTGNLSFTDLENLLKTFLPRFTDLEFHDFVKLTPSELRAAFEAFKEVNPDFLQAFKSLGLTKLVKDLKNAILNDLNAIYANSLKKDTPTSGNTDSPSS